MTDFTVSETMRAPSDPRGGGVLLAIDTAIGSSVAVGTATGIVEVASGDPRRHAEVIGDLIARAFSESGVTPAETTGVVVGIGPGPFTGLRVGIAAATAFATGRGIPLLPVQGHEAVALPVLERGTGSGVRVLQDAKRRELFVTEYTRLDGAGIPQRSADPDLMARDALIDDPRDVWPDAIPAGQLVRLAERRLASGAPFAPNRALYLRQPDVQQPSAPKRVST